MKKLSFILILLSLQGHFSFGQDSTDVVPNISLAIIARENQGNSYITAPTDIGNIEHLWFEANMVPNFIVRASKDSRLLGVITPQIIIRMYREESSPVRTPSYMPQLSVYYSLRRKNKVCSLSLFGKFVHHSNGQEGPFYLDNGDINLMNASFSTNYIETGIIKTSYSDKFNAVKFFSSSIEVHPKGLTIEELHGVYGLYKWNNIFSIFKLPTSGETDEKKASLSLKSKLSYTMGEFNNLNAFAFDRITASFTVYYHPKFLKEIGFFVQLYHGYDYYNIYFDHQRTMLRFGIMTDKIRF